MNVYRYLITRWICVCIYAIDYAFVNKIFNLENNTINQLDSNQIWSIQGNTVSNILYNQGLTLAGNISSTIEANDTHAIQDNIVATISNNVGKSINLNNVDYINGNMTKAIDSNTSFLSYSEITDNNVREIKDNTDFSYISFNTGNFITSNTFNSSTYSMIFGNKISSIHSNQNCLIYGNSVNGINFNIDVNEIRYNNLESISYNYNFDKIYDIAGGKLASCTGSVGSQAIVLDQLRNVEIQHMIINTDVINHTFLDSMYYLSLTASTDMQTSTYSTVSRWVWDLLGHYEEKALSTGMTYSGPIA